MTDEVMGGTETNDEIGAKEHVAPSPTPNTSTSSENVLKSTPSPASFATNNDITLRDDIAKILSTVKLPERPERKDAHSAGDAWPQKMPQSSAPIHTGSSATSKIEASPSPTPDEISPAATATQKEENPVRGSSLRTLKDDLRELVRTRKMSLVKAVALESEKKLRINESSGAEEIAATRSRVRRVKRFMITMVICVGLGIAALFTVAYVQTQRTTPRAVSYGSSFMFSEQTLTFPLGALTTHELRQQLSHTRTQVNLTLGAIARIVLIIKEEGPEAGEVRERPARAREFLEILAPSAPEDLLRSLNDEFFFGVHAIDENSPLLVMPINSYQNAFASMLQWESKMNEDLSPLFTRVFHQTTDESGAPRLARFEDVIIRNYDVRALKDMRGEIQMLYAFPTRSVLIIAESPHSFVEALARLRAERRI